MTEWSVTMATPSPARRNPKKVSTIDGREWKLHRQEEILAAAFEVFAAKGYAEARLDDVAGRAGIAKGTIYLYFKNKELLFRAVLRNLIHHSFADLEVFVREFPGTAEELLRKVLSRQYDEVIKNPKARSMFRLLIAESHKFPQLSEVYFSEVIAPSVAAMRILLEKGVASGEFRKTRIVEFPQILAGPAVLAVVWTLILGEQQRLDIDSYMEAHLELLLHELRNVNFSNARNSEDFLGKGGRR